MARERHTREAWSWCEAHNKCGYPSRDSAKDAIRTHRGNTTGVREYPCDAKDGYWHFGHLPDAVRRGLKTRDEWYEGWETRARRDPRDFKKKAPCHQHGNYDCSRLPCRALRQIPPPRQAG